jgi:hypothetical protein
VTDPVPVPEPPLTTVRNALLLEAVQMQSPPCELVTVKVLVPPLAATLTVVGLTLKLELQVPASWLMLMVWPAMVTVPVRAKPPFGDAVTVTEPEPLPEDPFVTARNPLFDTALQLQPVPCPTLTLNERVPPVAGSVVIAEGVTV